MWCGGVWGCEQGRKRARARERERVKKHTRARKQKGITFITTTHTRARRRTLRPLRQPLAEYTWILVRRLNFSRHALWSTSAAEHEPTPEVVMSITSGLHDAVCFFKGVGGGGQKKGAG